MTTQGRLPSPTSSVLSAVDKDPFEGLHAVKHGADGGALGVLSFVLGLLREQGGDGAGGGGELVGRGFLVLLGHAGDEPGERCRLLQGSRAGWQRPRP